MGGPNWPAGSSAAESQAACAAACNDRAGCTHYVWFSDRGCRTYTTCTELVPGYATVEESVCYKGAAAAGGAMVHVHVYDTTGEGEKEESSSSPELLASFSIPPFFSGPTAAPTRAGDTWAPTAPPTQNPSAPFLMPRAWQDECAFAAAPSPAALDSVSFPCVIKQFLANQGNHEALSKQNCNGGKVVWSCTGKSPWADKNKQSDHHIPPWNMIQNCSGGRCTIDYRWQGITGIPPEIGRLKCAHQIEKM